MIGYFQLILNSIKHVIEFLLMMLIWEKLVGWIGGGGKMTFGGNMEKSTIVFFEYLKDKVDEYIKNKTKNGE